MSKLLSVSSVAALAIALASCSTSTAPAAKATPRTASVVTTAAVPAVPTAPVSLTTNTTESKVAATLPVAALQAIVAALGGPVTIKMTDVASKDFTATLPTGSAAAIDPARTAGVFQFSAVRSSAMQSQVTSGTLLAQASNGSYTVDFKFTPFGATCRSGTTGAYFLSAGGVKTIATLTGFAIDNLGGLSFTYAVPASLISAYTIVVECDGVTGSFGA
jgi:hypothetical protein